MLSFSSEPVSVWEKLKKTTEPIIMYGTGNGADKVLDVFSEKGIAINGVTASNGFVRERTFRGFPVKPLSYFEELYKSFTVVISFGSSRPEVLENIREISKKHRVLVPVVPVIGTEIFDEDYLQKNERDIEKAYTLLADDFSKKVYGGYIDFLFGGEFNILESITTPESEVYESILKPQKGGAFVDIGAYRGDTVEKYLTICDGDYSFIVAAEPDKKTFKKLMENCGKLPNFKGVNAAVTDIDGEVYFSHNGGRQSAIGGDVKTDSVTLTSLCKGIIPDYIKIDAEGCELQIIESSGEFLRKYKPLLNVAAYHKNEDIFKLPLLLDCINGDYKIYLRHHPYVPAWDTIYYCV